MFDSGALDALLDEGVRRVFVEASRARHLAILVPATVLIEFSVGHGKGVARAARVLKIVRPLPIGADIAMRASELLIASAGGAADPSLTDVTVAAWAERYGAVATTDAKDLRALAAVGSGFDIYSVDDLLRAMRREPRRRR